MSAASRNHRETQKCASPTRDTQKYESRKHVESEERTQTETKSSVVKRRSKASKSKPSQTRCKQETIRTSQAQTKPAMGRGRPSQLPSQSKSKSTRSTSTSKDVSTDPDQRAGIRRRHGRVKARGAEYVQRRRARPLEPSEQQDTNSGTSAAIITMKRRQPGREERRPFRQRQRRTDRSPRSWRER